MATATRPSPAPRPELAQELTAEQREQAVADLATLPSAELHLRLCVHRDQGVAARDQGRDDVADSEIERGLHTFDALERQRHPDRRR